VAFQIRADAEFQATPVVFLSSLVSEREALGDGSTTGGFHFVAKPARLPRMIACIEKSLETKPHGDRLPTHMELQ
jgi:DNA-binding response OmpR family regulator